MSRALIASIGQPWMRDLAFGSHVVSALKQRSLPPMAEAVDLSFGTIAALQFLESGRFDRALFLTAQNRGRTPATIYELPLPAQGQSEEEIHARVGDCVMGCVSLDNLLIIARYYQHLPNVIRILELEPMDESWGPDLSEEVAPLVDTAAHEALRFIAGGSS